MTERIDDMKPKCHWNRVKRRLEPGSLLFVEGDSYCRCLQKCLPADEDATGEIPGSKEFPCGISHCQQVYDSLMRYESHYNSSHRHVCQTCQRVYPTSHLLEVHILETHDVMFAMLAQKQCMCLLADCPSRFKTWKDRKNHMIKIHKYPPNYRYDRAKPGKEKQAKPAINPAYKSASTRNRETNAGENRNIEKSMEADSVEKNHTDNSCENRNSEEAMEYEATENSPAGICDTSKGGETNQRKKPFVFSYRVPKDISFGQGVPRGFVNSRGRGRGRGKQKKKHWHNTSDRDTTVDIESVSMKDLSDALS